MILVYGLIALVNTTRRHPTRQYYELSDSAVAGQVANLRHTKIQVDRQ